MLAVHTTMVPMHTWLDLLEGDVALAIVVKATCIDAECGVLVVRIVWPKS